MLRDAFSFEGRIGRLKFFFANLVMALVAVVVVLGMTFFAAAVPRGPASVGALALVVLGLVIAVVWFGLALHVRRIRDIGWSPFYVVVGWFIFECADAIVAVKMPWLAVGSHHHTAVGAVVNIGFGVALLFLPGRADDMDDAARRAPRFAAIGSGPAAAPRAVASSPRGAQVGFGRRGVN